MANMMDNKPAANIPPLRNVQLTGQPCHEETAAGVVYACSMRACNSGAVAARGT